jgi:hypothetical protein
MLIMYKPSDAHVALMFIMVWLILIISQATWFITYYRCEMLTNESVIYIHMCQLYLTCKPLGI